MNQSAFILHNGALGDLLLSTPAFSLIREAFPHIYLAGRHDAVAFLQAAGVVNEACDSGSARFSSLYSHEIDEELKVFLGRFQAAYIFTTSRDSLAAGNMGTCVSQTRLILSVPLEEEVIHVSDYRLAQLSSCPGRHYSSHIPVRSEWRCRAKHMLVDAGWDREKHLVAIHTGSGGLRKCWPIDHFRELARMLHVGNNVFLVFISGPAEEGVAADVLDTIASGMPGNAIHLRGLALSEASAVLSLSSVYIGNDSGLTHLAAIVGTGVIALFGPTDPMLWRPLGEKVRVIRSPLDCAPCGDVNSRLCGKRRCLSVISPHCVYQEIEVFLKGMM